MRGWGCWYACSMTCSNYCTKCKVKLCFAKNLNCSRLFHNEWEVLHKKLLPLCLQLVLSIFSCFNSVFCFHASLTKITIYEVLSDPFIPILGSTVRSCSGKLIWQVAKSNVPRLQSLFYQETSAKNNKITKLYWISIFWHAGSETQNYFSFYKLIYSPKNMLSLT